MEKKGVVWVSTVLYILISLAVIGIVIAAVQPRINATKDKAIIEQTINILNELDQKIIEVDNSAEGNVRSLSLQLKKGILRVNADSSPGTIEWSFKGSSYKYSEPGIPISIGRIKALTTKVPRGFDINLTLHYDVNFISDLELQPAEIPYNIFIKNNGPGTIENINQIEIYSA